METLEFFRFMGWFLFAALMAVVNSVLSHGRFTKLLTYMLFLVSILAMLVLLGNNFAEMFV